MRFYKQMKIWGYFGVTQKEAIFAMLQKKTQALSLQAYLIHHGGCYQSIALEVLEQMFGLERTAVLSLVNVLLTQGLIDAHWNEDATVLVFIEALSSRVEAVAVQLEEKVEELTEVNRLVVEELKGEKKEEFTKYKTRKTGIVFGQKSLKMRANVYKG